MDPEQRLTCAELLAHAYFDDYEPMRAPAVKTRRTRVGSFNQMREFRQQKFTKVPHFI